MLPQPFKDGTVLYVCSAEDPAGEPWALVEVKHCCPVDNGWVVGCQVVRPHQAGSPLFNS